MLIGFNNCNALPLFYFVLILDEAVWMNCLTSVAAEVILSKHQGVRGATGPLAQ